MSSSEDRVHRAAAEARGPRAPWWARALAARERPLPKPPMVRIDPVRRSWLAAFWHARIGVQAGLTLDDFLRSRLARYLAALPVPRARLPVAVDVEDGQLAIRPAPPPGAAAEATPSAEAWLAPLVAADGPQVRREVADLEGRLASLDLELDAAHHHVQERTRQLAADVAVGLVAGPPDVDATAEQLGRPPIRSGAPREAALAFAGAAVAAETWQIALPILAGAGIETTALRAEAARAPAELTLAAVFALAIAAAMFALAHVGLDATVALFQGDPDDRRRRWLASTSLASGGAAAVVAAAVASLRVPAAGARFPAPALVLLLLVVPLAAALVLRAARASAAAREADLEAALAWDRERARVLGERIRRLDELHWAEVEVGALEDRREEARRRLRDLDARAVRAARLVADAERREREALSRLAQSLVAALELDRYEFVRQASARGAHALLAPRRRKPTEAPAPIVADAAPEPRLEPAAGRLAS